VVTNAGYSDWSTQPFPQGPGALWLRVCREADDYMVEASNDGLEWQQLRLAHLHEGRGLPVLCGVYACSPKGAGFRTEFGQIAIDAGRLV
jgi:regulation of enolase protein 1 (concanavalin A-like superfamily)